jgi:hypothetical protein
MPAKKPPFPTKKADDDKKKKKKAASKGKAPKGRPLPPFMNPQSAGY